jgi:hypothetical protein
VPLPFNFLRSAMWTCEKCGANLLATTVACPICQMPEGGQELLRETPRASHPAESLGFWVKVVVGGLIPPLGILFLLIFLAQKMTPEEPSE